MALLTIGDQFPDFSLTALVGGNLEAIQAETPSEYFTTITNQDYAGQWRVIFFWPKDFTFVCPTEIAAFGQFNDQFVQRGAQVLGASVDNEFVHYNWRLQHKSLRDLPFPMLSDIKHELTAATGVLNKAGVADRATFIVDPDNTIQFVSVTAGSVGRNVEEVLRVLDALQTHELCPCGWTPNTPVLDVAKLMKEAS